MENLNYLGWDKYLENNFKPYEQQNLYTGRVAVENKTNYLLYTSFGEVSGEISGKLFFNSESLSELPKVGDWVVVSLFDNNTKAVIHNVLPRKTKISRKSADKKTEEQIIAANVDVVFIVQSLDENFNINRMERYLAAVNQSGALPVAILNKSDICDDADYKKQLVEKVQPGLDVINVSALTGEGIDNLKIYFSLGKTIVFVGSSGVGKSSLINKITGIEMQKMNSVSDANSKGKHTTTKRELIILPDGGLLIDTPGMREFGLWDAAEGLSKTFSEFEELALKCKFKDCTHTHETNCAVVEAVENGSVSKPQYENYIKMRKEIKYLETKQDFFAKLEEKRKWKNIHKEIKRLNKDK